MTTTDTITAQPQLIAVSRLEKSSHNARRTSGKVGMEELKASLLAHGLMQNLVVTDAGDGGSHQSDWDPPAPAAASRRLTTHSEAPTAPSRSFQPC